MLCVSMPVYSSTGSLVSFIIFVSQRIHLFKFLGRSDMVAQIYFGSKPVWMTQMFAICHVNDWGVLATCISKYNMRVVLWFLLT